MTLMCIDRSQSPTHKGNFLQGGKQTVSNNINHQQNANHRRNNSCSPPLNKSNNNNKDEFSNSKSQDSPRKLERSSSESSAINSRGQSSSSNSSRYKTELCRPYEESGVCKYGDKCQFAHGIKELRSMARHPKYKTELCRTFHSTGLCPYGPRCHFIHNSEQTKKILLNNLTGQPTSNNRPKALSSIGSAGDVSPASSNGGTPTGTKSFDDMFQMSPASPGNVFFPQDNQVNNFQRYSSNSSDYPVYDYKTDIYDSINVFNDKLVSVSSLDNFSFQSGPVLELCPSAPLTPATPLDSNHLIFRLPIFDGFQNGN